MRTVNRLVFRIVAFGCWPGPKRCDSLHEEGAGYRESRLADVTLNDDRPVESMRGCTGPSAGYGLSVQRVFPPSILVLALWGYASLFGLAAFMVDKMLVVAFRPGDVPGGLRTVLLLAFGLVAVLASTPLVTAVRQLWRGPGDSA